MADKDEQGQLLTLESEKLGSGDAAPVTKMAIDLDIVSSSVGPATQALSSASSAMKLAAFKIRTQRYLQMLFRMFSM